MEGHDRKSGITEHHTPTQAGDDSPSSGGVRPAHGAPEVTGVDEDTAAVTTVEVLEASKKGWFAYFKTRDFYIVLVLGCVHILFLLSTSFLIDPVQSNPRSLHYLHQYFLFTTGGGRYLHPSLPDIL